ncbi:MAG: PEGA domain-containing protein [Candidatus Omnitrophica bacterium]|nr:PEGA domain-containing protein [Candidatus Omnitrophota bacterium]
MAREQKVRTVLFYVSVLIFFAGLPVILSSALGYRFDRRNFTFTKTGLISIKTTPGGARVYLNERPVSEKTPCTIPELMPGTYRIETALDGYYPYASDVQVSANKVTKLEKIILFPLRPEVDQLNKERLAAYWIDQTRGLIFYADPETNTVYKADLWNERFERFTAYMPLKVPPKRWEVSPDRKKLMYFNSRQIGIAEVRPPESWSGPAQFVLDYPGGAIQEVFWHSDSYYLVVVSDRRIDMLEAKPGALPFTVVALRRRQSSPQYDVRSDVLYFVDIEKGEDGKPYDNLYRLELRPKLVPFMDELMRKKNNEPR